MPDLNEMAREYQHGGKHYTEKKVQPWDAMEGGWMTEEQFKGFLIGNVIKYIARFQEKGGVLDLQKCKHYLDKLIEVW
jgi:hypothetical protein